MAETKCFRDAFRDQLHELIGQPNINAAESLTIDETNLVSEASQQTSDAAMSSQLDQPQLNLSTIVSSAPNAIRSSLSVIE